MADTLVEIPDREWFKPSEVCEIASVQPYVLRSWEIEFPSLGMSRSSGSGRLYRRSDVERVLRIRRLVFGEGLTLAGVRRALEGESTVEDADPPAVVDANTRERLAAIRRDLRELHEWLSVDRRRASAPSAPEASQAELPELGEHGHGPEAWPPRRSGRKRARKT